MSVVLMVSFPVLVACEHTSKMGVIRHDSWPWTHSSDAAVNLYFYDLSFDNFRFFLDPHPNAPSKGLGERLRFGHGQREHFAGGNHREWNIGA